jgi:hypothetical protein
MRTASDQPIVIFGNSELAIWGLALGGEQPRLVLTGLNTAPNGIELQSGELDREDDAIWTFAAGDNSLKIERAQATTATAESSGLEPVRVTGTARVSGEQREIDIAGALAGGRLDQKTGSLRLVGSWFPAGHEVNLLAVRPKGAKGQDKDAIEVAALGEKEAVVFDPRLSTTYGRDGEPRRAGVELWIGADEDGDQYPRRVAGVATGSAVRTTAGNLTLSAHALRCLSRGEAGTGVYVLIQAA